MTTTDPNGPGTGNADDKGTSNWEKLGFTDENAMIEAAKTAGDLRSKVDQMEADLKKSNESRGKTDTEYMRQSTEIGELKKKVKEYEDSKTGESDKDDGDPDSVDDVIESISIEETKMLDAVLDDESNAALKSSIEKGGKSAMAEFVTEYRKEAPIESKGSLFANLKKKKPNTVEKSAIAKAVKDLFKNHDNENKESLGATPQGGAPEDRATKTMPAKVVGTVGVDFFRAKT